VLILKGATNKDIFFVRKGIVRSFYHDKEKLEEITFQLYPEYKPVLNIHSILFNEPSRFTYQALEDTKVYQINYDALLELTSQNRDLLELNRRFFARNAMRQAV